MDQPQKQRKTAPRPAARRAAAPHRHAPGEEHDHVHASHPAIVVRLKRALGHLAATIEMFGDGRPCVELAQQLAAVEKAVGNAKRELIRDHIEHCLVDSRNGSERDFVEEFKALASYL